MVTDESNDPAKHVRSMQSTPARAHVRTLEGVEVLRLLLSTEKRATVREAIRGRLSKLTRDTTPREWTPRESDAVVRDTIVPGRLYTCPVCERDLPIGDGLDEIGVRRKRNLVRGGVEYVIRPQSRCHRCQRRYHTDRRTQA